MPRKKNQRPNRPNRRIPNKVKRQGWCWYHKLLVIVLAVVLLLGLAYYLLSTYSNQPFRHVSIETDGHAVSVAKVRPVVEQHLTGGFFTFHTHPLQATLKAWPWVKAVSIRRVWPDQLDVSIEEHKAQAVWNQHQLLSDEGVLFQPNEASFPAGLPTLMGPAGSEHEVQEIYQQVAQWMQKFGLRVTNLTWVDHIWRLRLDSGAQIYFNELEKEQRAIFNRLYRQVLHDKMDRVERIDLRYVGGASVQWKK